MSIQKIIELVRREDVVLWLGSGFSLYAGYPTGKALADKIYQTLNAEEQEEISKHLSLDDLTEQFVRAKNDSRNELNVLLRNEFTKPPKSRKWHEVMAGIPHFKTIITTNYDRLIEDAYKNALTVIWQPSHVAYIVDRKPDLFKIHGDIMDFSSIVITRTDYTDFFTDYIGKNLIWSTIKTRIANKAIVFIGYDLEDENIKVMLKEINQALGNNRKEIFLIAPGLMKSKQRYLANFKIQYIDSTGEIFFEKLERVVKENITQDFNTGVIGSETLRQFFANNNIVPHLTGNEKSYRLNGVKAANSSVTQQMQFKTKPDRELFNKWMDFKNGLDFSDLKLEAEALDELKLLMNGINVIGDDKADFQLILSHSPSREGAATLSFADGTEFEDIEYKVYRSVNKVEFKGFYKQAEYSFSFLQSDFADDKSLKANFSFNIESAFKNVNDAIQVFSLGLHIAKGESCTIYVDGTTTKFPFKLRETSISIENISANLSFFKQLKDVEKLYGVRFENINGHTEADWINVENAVFFGNGETYTQPFTDTLSYPLSEIQLFNPEVLQKGTSFMALSKDVEEVTILGQTIPLGYKKVILNEIIFPNWEDVKSGKATAIEFAPKSGEITFEYIKELPKTGS